MIIAIAILAIIISVFAWIRTIGQSKRIAELEYIVNELTGGAVDKRLDKVERILRNSEE